MDFSTRAPVNQATGDQASLCSVVRLKLSRTFVILINSEAIAWVVWRSSSISGKIMIITEELYRLTDAFDRCDVDYALCGGLAVAIHGRPRLTLDIDFVVPTEQMERAIATAATVGFDDPSGWISLPSSRIGIHRLYRVNKIHQGEFLTLDLLEVDRSDNSVFVDQECVEVEGKQIRLLSRVSLIKMKRESNRLKDKLDVEMLSDYSDER